MKLPALAPAGSFEKAPAGNHLAVAYEFIDMGTQERSPYQGQERSPCRQIWIGWELPNESMEDGRPFVIGRKYNYSSNENSAMRKDLESWRGKAFTPEEFGTFEIQSVLGHGCFLQVTHTESQDGTKTYANVDTVAALPKGTEAPATANARVYFALDEFDQDVFDGLSERMQGIIAASPEFQALSRKGTVKMPDIPQADSGTDDDGVPF